MHGAAYWSGPANEGAAEPELGNQFGLCTKNKTSDKLAVFLWVMHQSERVSSTSGNDKLDNSDNHDNNNDEDSDIDSWPEDTTSQNESKVYYILHRQLTTNIPDLYI